MKRVALSLVPRGSLLVLVLALAAGCASTPAVRGDPSACAGMAGMKVASTAASQPTAADCTCNVEGAEAQGSAPVGSRARLPAAPLPGTTGAPVDLRGALAGAPLTVVTFFSATCPCQRAHDPRLLRYAEEFGARGVAFYAVDVEADSSLERDRREASARGYTFPILSDPDGRVADAVGARYATETLVLDREGRVRFRGGVDSDQNRLHDGARLFLRDALAALLDGRDPAERSPKSFGCSLRRR